MITTTVEGGKRLESEHTTLSGLLESALTDLEIRHPIRDLRGYGNLGIP